MNINCNVKTLGEIPFSASEAYEINICLVSNAFVRVPAEFQNN